MEFDLQGVDGRTNVRISAYTTARVTRNMRPVNWKMQAAKWEHLQGIKASSTVCFAEASDGKQGTVPESY